MSEYLVQCAEDGNISYLSPLKRVWKTGSVLGMSEAAIENGQMVCLRYIYENGILPTNHHLQSAARCGELECLECCYIYYPGVEYTTEYDKERLMWNACLGGNLNCVRFLWDRGYKLNIECAKAASLWGELECFSFIFDIVYRQLPPEESRTAFVVGVAEEAVKGDNLSCLVLIASHLEADISSEMVLVTTATEHGSIRCLEYLVDNGYAIPENIVRYALDSYQLECAEYFHRKGYEMPYIVVQST